LFLGKRVLYLSEGDLYLRERLYISGNEHGISSKEPCAAVKEPYISVMEL
jgi:hypothetical protein